MTIIVPHRLDITAEFEISKIRDRVFQIGHINNDIIFDFSELLNVINLGFKFIPSYFYNTNDFLSFFNHLIEDFLINFNRNIFFMKNSSKNTNLDKLNSQIENVLKSLKRNNNKNKKYPLQLETLELELEIYTNLFKFKNEKEFINNISYEEFKEIKRYLQENPFKVVNCDKNVGSAIISHELYDSLCLKHLDDKDSFIFLQQDPLESTQVLITNKLIELMSSKDISVRLRNNLSVKNSKLGKFNILPKIHKSKFGTRPIINSINHPTSNISEFIDFLLQPFVITSDSYIKDSQNLIQKLENKTFPENIKICSLDFESLYSNIDLKDALKIISEFMQDKLSNNHITSLGFHNILKLLFDNNVFSYNKKYYKQIKGIAMGSKCGPSIANIYLSCLERSFLFIHKPLFYKRYIDDIFCILLNCFDIDILVKFFGYLKLNLVCDSKVNFLDFNISFDKILKKFKFSLFIKPTNTFSYLLTSSNHPKFVFENLPFGIFMRFRRTNSSLVDYYFFSTQVANQLVSRGYTLDNINKIVSTIADKDRVKLLDYKEKLDFKKDNIILCRYYDSNLLNLNFNLLNSIDNLSLKFNHFYIDKFNIVTKMQTNIGSLIINNVPSFLFNNNMYKYHKCFFKNCKICKYGDTGNSFLDLNNSYKLFFKSNASCNSKEFVYIIKCFKCSVFYIGQSGNTVKTRIGQHLNCIYNFIPFNACTPVSNHFKLNSHKEIDFKLYIFQTDLDFNLRIFTERKLIKLFLLLNLRLINVDTRTYIDVSKISI